jgi:chromatin assembly factor 1 subunit B
VTFAPSGMPTAVAILQHWHDEGAPVFSLDFAAKSSGRLATGGADKKVRIWRVKTGADNEQQVEYRATINGHDKSVNAVRFSPSGTLLASAGDDGVINVYKLSQAPVSSAPAFGEDKDELPNKENWRMVAQLR